MSSPAATAPPASSAPFNPLRAAFHFLTSLKLAVAILGISALLVFLGTIAQVNEGLYLAQARWFKSWIIIRHEGDPWYVLIYPGGYTLGVLLIFNLMGAHLRRFKFPPGGWPALVIHYSLVMGALFAITWGLLWSPWIFFMACTALLVLDMLVGEEKIGWKRLVGSGKKIGVDLIHFGIVILLVGQLATDMLAEESYMAMKEGQTVRYSQNSMGTELVIASDVEGDAKNENVVAIPESLMVQKDAANGETIRHDKLPFDIRMTLWQGNSDLIDLTEAREAEGRLRQALATLESKFSSPDVLAEEARRAAETPGLLRVWRESLQELGASPGDDITPAVEQVKQDSARASALLAKLKAGFRRDMVEAFRKEDANMRFAAQRVEADQPITDSSPARLASSSVGQRYYTQALKIQREMDSRNIPSAVVELIGPGGSIGTWLVSPHLKPQTIRHAGKEYRLSLRFERHYHPFSVTLLKTTHDVYAGTDTPKDFRSRVRVVHPEKNEDRETEIYMNAPLRYEGLTFFQHQMSSRAEIANAQGFSQLQVVRNPSWFSPYFGCALVGYGMTRHFLLHLLRFIRKRQTS
jgi:hypothetical protein